MKPRVFAVVLCAGLVLAAGAAFSQGLQPAKIWNLTIRVNVTGADIYVDNELLNGISVKVAGGAHNVRVTAPGYADFIGPVQVSKDMVFTVALRAERFPLTIRVNIQGATVYLDGNDLTAKPAAVAAGQHTLQVVAAGYQDYNSVVDVNGPMVVDVNMVPAGFLLTVNANVADATVILNNFAKGPVPYAEYLPPGGYTVRISADGFADYIASVSLDRAITVSAQLRPVPRPPSTPATLSLVIPPPLRDPGVRATDPVGQVKVWVDNKLVNPSRVLEGIQIAPGRHKIRITTGALQINVGDVTLQPGTRYVIQLNLDVQIRAVQVTQE